MPIKTRNRSGGSGTISTADAKKKREDRMRESLNRSKKRGGKTSFFKFPEGKTRVRILPSMEPFGDFYFESGFHYKVGPEQSTIACPRLTSGDRCPICEKVRELYKSDSDSDQHVAKRLRSKSRYFANALVEGTGVVVLPYGSTVHTELVKCFLDPEFGDFTDPETGRWVTIEKEGTGMESEYFPRVSPKQTSLGDEDEIEELLSQRVDLMEVVKPPTYEELAELLEATDLDLLRKREKNEKGKRRKERVEE